MRSSSYLAAALAALVAGAARADAGAAPGPMEDVLVTATQRGRQAADLPLGWAALEDADLRMVGHTHVSESFQRIAGGWIARGNGQESLTALRSPVLTGAGGCGAFVMAQDGIALRAPGFCNVNQLFDANTEQARRIEVLKGPATALYGSGAMHGVINVLSIDPAAGPSHAVGVEAGPRGFRRASYQAALSAGRHGLAVAANAASDGGYKRDSGYRQRKATLRHRFSGGGWDVDSIAALANLEQETAGFIEGRRAYRNSARKRENPNPEAYRDAWSARAQFNFGRALGRRSRLLLTPYWRRNEMEFLQHFLPWQPVEENGHESLGLNGKWYVDSGRASLASGLDLERTKGWLRETQAEPFGPNQPAGTHYDYRVAASMASVWSQLDWEAGSRLGALAGIRYERSGYDYDNRGGDGSACAPAASACRFYRPADREDDFRNWSLNLGALYRLSGTRALYARASRGFRAPQATELYRLQSGQRAADLGSEEVGAIEVGARGAGARFQYELGGYYLDKDEVIFQDSNRHNISGASTSHHGLDIALRWRVATELELALDAGIARHRYGGGFDLRGIAGDIEGNDIDTAPRHFGSLRLAWRPHPRHRVELEWVHMGGHYLEPENRHRYGGHDLLNLRLASQLGGRLRLALRATNLTDEDYAERADFGFGAYRYFVGEPRALYARLSYRLRPL